MQSGYRDTQQPPTLQQALSQSAAECLYRLVRDFWTGKPRPTRKDDMVSVLLQVASEQNLRKLWPALGELYKAAVAESVWSRDGAFNADQFRARYGRLPGEKEVADDDEARGVGRSGYQRSRDDPTSLLELIMPRGTLPRDVQLTLKQFVPKPEKAKVKVTEAPADVFPIPAYQWDPETNKRHEYSKPVPVLWVETEHQAARELLAVLRLAEPGKLRIWEKSRWPTPTTIRTVTRALDGGDYFPGGPGAQPDEDGDRFDARTPGPIRALAWPMLLEAGGLLNVRKQKLSRSSEGEAALTRPPYETLRELWEAYAEYFDLDEFRRIDTIKGQTGKGRRGFTDPGERRDAIAAALAECPIGQWVKIDDFSTHMRAAGHHFQVTSDPWPLYINEPRYDSLGYGGHHGWNILQFRYLLCVLMEYVATLGLIDIGYIPPDGARSDYDRMPGADDLLWFSRYDGLMYLRLNAFGAYCLNLTASYEPRVLEIPVALAISPDLRVTASADLKPADRMLLDTFAMAVRKDVWQLDRDCTLAALAAGRTIAEISQLLESAGGGPLPDAAGELFADAEDRIGAFTDQGPARLVRCRDGTLASLVSQSPLTHKTCHRVSENVLVVPHKSEAAFLKGLRELGFVLPARGRNG